jgi:hypothetical protein
VRRKTRPRPPPYLTVTNYTPWLDKGKLSSHDSRSTGETGWLVVPVTPLIRRLMDDDFNGMIKGYLRRRVYRRLTDETDIA